MKVFLLMLCFVAGCVPIRKHVDEKETAVDYLNRGDYDRAVELLKKILAEHPDDDHARILLASAYSGSVGFDMITSFISFKPLIMDDLGSSQASEVSQVARIESSEQLAKSILSFFQQTNRFLNVALKMPHLQVGKRNYLVEATDLLAKVPEGSPRFLQARTYATLLELTLFMNYIRDSFVNLKPGVELSSYGWLCAFEPEIFIVNIGLAADALKRAADNFERTMSVRGKKLPQPITNLVQEAQRLKDVYASNEALLAQIDLAILMGKNEVCR